MQLLGLDINFINYLRHVCAVLQTPKSPKPVTDAEWILQCLQWWQWWLRLSTVASWFKRAGETGTCTFQTDSCNGCL